MIVHSLTVYLSQQFIKVDKVMKYFGLERDYHFCLRLSQPISQLTCPRGFISANEGTTRSCIYKSVDSTFWWMNKLLLLLISGMENISDASFRTCVDRLVRQQGSRRWWCSCHLPSPRSTGQYSQSLYHLVNFRGVKWVHTPAVWKLRILSRVHGFFMVPIKEQDLDKR